MIHLFLMNLSLLNWNIRGMNSSKKKQILHDLIDLEKIDVIMIQETKMENFSTRQLRKISHRFDLWHWVPAIGRSGGILFGGDSNKIKVLRWEAHRFCLDIQLENKLDSSIWQLTIVYGPVNMSLKKSLWAELDLVQQHNIPLWVVCGDFNVILNRSERSGSNFDVSVSKNFNSFIGRHNLLELKLDNRKYTWSNGHHFALLDRIFTTLPWDHKYPSSVIKDASSFGSDHCPLILTTSSVAIKTPHTFRIDPVWFDHPQFLELVHKWWNEYPLDMNNLATSWQHKLQFMRRKISGWARNYYGQKKKDKLALLSKLHALELIQDQ